MGTKKVTEKVRLDLKRQPIENDTEDQIVVSTHHKGGTPGGSVRTSGSNNPGGHGRGGKASRRH